MGRGHSLSRRRWVTVTKTLQDSAGQPGGLPLQNPQKCTGGGVSGKEMPQRPHPRQETGPRAASLEQDEVPTEDSFPAPRPGPSGGCSGSCHPQSCCPKCSARPLSSSTSRAGLWGPGRSGNSAALSVLNSACPWRPLNEAPSLPILGFHCPSCPEVQPGEAPPCFSPPPPHCVPVPSYLPHLPPSPPCCGSQRPPYSLPSPPPPLPTALS